ncbi:MAG: DUF2269 family protein [Acidimicrobiales bacterium]
MGPNTVLYQVVLVVHILCAVVGFGSILVTGGYAGAARRVSEDGQVSEAVRRYFRPGPNLASRFIYAVPVLGLVMVGMSGGGDLSQSWLWLGSGLWLAAAGLATAVVWPAEARIAALVSGARGAGGSLEVPAAIAQEGRRASWAAAVMDLAVTAAFVVMIARPGG